MFRQIRRFICTVAVVMAAVALLLAGPTLAVIELVAVAVFAAVLSDVVDILLQDNASNGSS